MTKRIEYIDIAKGICIILLLLQHAHTYYQDVDIREYYTMSFRVPLFFLLSGCFFRPTVGFKEFCVKKINTLLIPFFFFYLLFSVGLPNILHLVGYQGIRQTSSLGWQSLLNFWTGTAHGYSNNPVWFLMALFWLSTIFYGIRYLAQKTSMPLLVTAVLSVLCGVIGISLGVFGIHTPMHTDNALTACPYFFLGYALNNETNILHKEVKKYTLIIPIIICISGVYFLSPGIDFLGNSFPYDKALQAYSAGILGSAAIVMVSYMIGKSKALCFYGRNTLIVLCMQMPVLQPINLIIKRLQIDRGGVGLALLFLSALIAMIFVIKFLNRFFPWAVGKESLIKLKEE